MNNVVLQGDVLKALKSLKDNSVDFVYTDPPFNTGLTQKDKRSGRSYLDSFDDYFGWVSEWVTELHRVMKDNATIYLHLDERSAYLVRSNVLDVIFGKKNYLSTIIWAYDYGGRHRDRWPQKHDVILVYAKHVGHHIFNKADIDKLPYMSPPLRKGQKRNDGKMPTDVWWMSIIGTNSPERIGYPNQKPVQLYKRAMLASSNKDAVVLDPFGGSGTLGAAALDLDRKFILIDKNEQSIETMKQRFAADLDKIEFKNV